MIIFLIKNLGRSAQTFLIANEKNEDTGAYILLDAGTFMTSMEAVETQRNQSFWPQSVANRIRVVTSADEKVSGALSSLL